MPTEIQEPATDSLVSPHPLLLLLAQVAIRRKRLILIEASAIAALALAVAAFLPNLYTATVVILPPQSNSTSAAMLAQLGNLGALASMSGGLSIKNPNDLQVSLLKSRGVEDAMVTRFHLQAEYHKRYVSSARKRWERMTAIDNGLKDGLIHLSVTDRNPHRAADLVNGWVEEYRRLTATLAVTEASQRRLFFERELDGARDELSRAEENLKDTQQKTGVLEIDSQARAMIASAAMLRAQVAAKQVEIRAMREFAAEQNPDLARTEQELSGLEAQLASMDVANSRNAGDLVSPKGKITQAGLDYTRALREVKYREAMYELLARQYEVARVDEARQGALIQVVDPAIVPDRPSSHYRLWLVLCALLMAMPMALFTAWTAEVTASARRLYAQHGSWKTALESSLNRGTR